MSIQPLIANLENLINNLPKSNVRFLYFLKQIVQGPNGQSQYILQPMVITYLSEWVVQGTRCYIGPGLTAQYCYVYKINTIKHMVRVTPLNASGNRFIANFLGNPVDKIESEHGNHLTLGIERTRPNNVVLRTHFVTYNQDPIDPYIFTRDQDRCDFIGNQAYLQYNKTQFSQLQCLKGTAPTIGDVYTAEPFMINVLQELYRTLYTTPPAIPGGNLSSSVNIGKKGGKYITKPNGKKKYIQRGGAVPVTYRSLSLTSVETVAFLTNRIFSKILEEREDLKSVQVFLDETDSLGPDNKLNLVILYDFSENARMVFHMNMNKVLRAAYANAHPQTASEDEQRALEYLITASSIQNANIGSSRSR
jgi:hypothetical protein